MSSEAKSEQTYEQIKQDDYDGYNNNNNSNNNNNNNNNSNNNNSNNNNSNNLNHYKKQQHQQYDNNHTNNHNQNMYLSDHHDQNDQQQQQKQQQQHNNNNNYNHQHHIQQYHQQQTHTKNNMLQQQSVTLKTTTTTNILQQHQQQHQQHLQQNNSNVNINKNVNNNININKQQHPISITITKTQKRGTLISYYYVYLIQGHDTKGTFSTYRRFNEFYSLRTSLLTRWPGCFIPSIPAKNALAKNDPTIIKKRTRYLNQFVQQISSLPHLYYSEQFQTLLRSQQQDVTNTYNKWPQPTSQSIINKYRINFAQLAGKINSFHQLIKRNQSQLTKQRQAVKLLAESHDRVIKAYSKYLCYYFIGALFIPNNIFKQYQKQCYSTYCSSQQRQRDMLYMNQNQVKLQQHQTLVKQALVQNQYWLLYDIIRHQQRDALAFSQVFDTKLRYQQKKLTLQQKIIDNQRKSTQLVNTKKPTLNNNNNQQLIKKLQHQVQQLQQQKQNILILIDIMSAMISYIEIQRYKKEKRNSYGIALDKLCREELNSVENLKEVWSGLQLAGGSKLSENTVSQQMLQSRVEYNNE